MPEPRICPECGEPATARWPVSASLWPKRRMIPTLLVLLAAAALGVWLWKTSDRVVLSSGTPMPRLLEPGMSPQRLASLAAGEEELEGGLHAALLTATAFPLKQPGITAIEVGWAPAPNTASVYTRRGWPAPWRTRSERRWYEDPDSRQGFVPSSTDTSLNRPRSVTQGVRDVRHVPPRDRFSWTGAKLYHHPPPEQAGGALVTETYDLYAALWPLAAAIVVYTAGSALLLLVRIVRRRRESLLLRRLVLLAAACAAVLMLALLVVPSKRTEGPDTFASARPVQRGTPPGQVYWTLDGFTRLPLTRDQLAAGAAIPDQELARSILDAIPAPPEPDLFLAAAPVPEAVLAGASYRSFSPKLRLLAIQTCRYERRGDFGMVEPLPAPPRLLWTGFSNRLTLQWGAGPTRSDITEVAITLQTALAVIAGLWLIWILSRLVAAVSLAITARRRRCRRQCVACGYG